MIDNSGLVEYLMILTGNAKVFSKNFTGKEVDERKLYPIFRFAFEKIMGWSPRETAQHLNIEVLNLLRLQTLYKKITKPNEIDPNKDCFYLAVILYPDEFNIIKKDLVLYEYEKVLDGLRVKLPKNFFDGGEGIYNSYLCLQHAIQRKGFNSPEDMYLFFADKEKAETFLKKYRLYQYYTKNYEHPLDYLQESLPESEKDECLYHYYRFYYEFNILFGQYFKKYNMKKM